MPNMEASESIKSTYKKYKDILDNSPFAILEINANTKEISYFNTKFLKISGYNSEYLLNKPIKIIIWEEDCEIIFKTSEGKKIEIRIDCKNGTIKWLSGYKVCNYNEIGEKIGVSLWLEDISVKKKVEELIKGYKEIHLNQIQIASQSKSDFLRCILSDSLKSILDSIIQFPYMLMEQVCAQLNEGKVKIPPEYFEGDKYILIIAKYDDEYGAIDLFTSVPLDKENIMREILTPVFDIKKPDIFLPFKEFYAQAYKFKIEDPEFPRGEKQTYGLVFIRNKGHPNIPFHSIKEIKHKFLEIGNKNILKNDNEIFQIFFDNIKNNILPLSPQYLLYQSNIDEIQKSYENLLQDIERGQSSDQKIIKHVELILNSFINVLNTLKDMFSIPLD